MKPQISHTRRQVPEIQQQVITFLYINCQPEKETLYNKKSLQIVIEYIKLDSSKNF